MRYYLIISILLLFFNCKNFKEKKTLLKDKVHQINNDTTHSNNLLNQDTSSIRDKEVKKVIKSKYPRWIEDFNLDINKVLAQYGNSEIDNYVKLNDSLSYATFIFHSGVCSEYTLYTYLHKREVDNIDVKSNCDMDLSATEYESKDYEIISSKIIRLKEYREYVDDSLIDPNGSIKNGLDFLEVDTKIDSVITSYIIKGTGVIEKTSANNM